MVTNFVGIETAIEEYLSFSGDEGRVDKPLILKKASDIIEKVASTEQDTHKIVLLRLGDYKVMLPKDFKKVIQVLYRDSFDGYIQRDQVVNWVRKIYDGSGCDIVVSKECPNCDGSEVVKVTIDRLWDQSHPEYHYNHMKSFYSYGGLRNDNKGVSSIFDPNFRIMKYSQHNFFNTDLHVKGCLNLDDRLLVNESVEYKLDLPYLKSSTKDGWVLISYLATKTDDNGYRLIKNRHEVFEAINWAVEATMLYRMFRKSKDRTYESSARYAQQMADIKIARAREVLDTPDFQAWSSFLDNHWNKIYPYYNAEQNMNRHMPDQFHKIFNDLKP